MKLSVGIQMDPIQSINIKGDSTFAMMLEAQSRGHRPGQHQKMVRIIHVYALVLIALCRTPLRGRRAV